MTPPQQGSRWIYDGPGDGNGQTHLVAGILQEHDAVSSAFGPVEVATWSITGSVAGNGWSWLGPVAAFYQNFRPAATQEPPKGGQSAD